MEMKGRVGDNSAQTGRDLFTVAQLNKGNRGSKTGLGHRQVSLTSTSFIFASSHLANPKLQKTKDIYPFT